jgi:hypothetical protein
MIGTHKMTAIGGTGVGPLERDASLYGTLSIIAVCLAMVAVTMLLPGCSNSSQAHAVDAPQAREALKIALDEWKKGETPQSLTAAATPIVVQDFEWAAGARLINYEIVGDGQPEDANLRAQVKLTLAAAKGQGKSTDKKVWYVVGTSPKVTVFRDMMKR